MKRQMESEFLTKYKNFKNFKEGEYKEYFELCMKSLDNYEFFTYMKLSNDLNSIPPVKSFLLYYQEEVTKLMGEDNKELDTYAKRGIGAFFGMLFKFVLGYQTNKSVKITMHERFNISTASVFKK